MWFIVQIHMVSDTYSIAQHQPWPKISKSDDDDDDAMDERNSDNGTLFEWVGLACLGS